MKIYLVTFLLIAGLGPVAKAATVTGFTCTTDSMMQLSSKLLSKDGEYRNVIISDDAKYAPEGPNLLTGVWGEVMSVQINKGKLEVEILANQSTWSIKASEVRLADNLRNGPVLFTGNLAAAGDSPWGGRFGLSQSQRINCLVTTD